MAQRYNIPYSRLANGSPSKCDLIQHALTTTKAKIITVFVISMIVISGVLVILDIENIFPFTAISNDDNHHQPIHHHVDQIICDNKTYIYSPSCKQDLVTSCITIFNNSCKNAGNPGDYCVSTPDLDCFKSTTNAPTSSPTVSPTTAPTSNPTPSPTNIPTSIPTNNPTPSPTNIPTSSPTNNPTPSPTANPTPSPTNNPTIDPTKSPSNPTLTPSINPTTSKPTTTDPTTDKPTTSEPSFNPSLSPTTTTSKPTSSPSLNPTIAPITSIPTTIKPTSVIPTTDNPTTTTPTTLQPTSNPSSNKPSIYPSMSPTTSEPTNNPSISSTTSQPTVSPSLNPTTSTSLPPTTSRPTTGEPTSAEPTKSPKTPQPTTDKPTPPPSPKPDDKCKKKGDKKGLNCCCLPNCGGKHCDRSCGKGFGGGGNLCAPKQVCCCGCGCNCKKQTISTGLTDFNDDISPISSSISAENCSWNVNYTNYSPLFRLYNLCNNQRFIDIKIEDFTEYDGVTHEKLKQITFDDLSSINSNWNDTAGGIYGQYDGVYSIMNNYHTLNSSFVIETIFFRENGRIQHKNSDGLTEIKNVTEDSLKFNFLFNKWLYQQNNNYLVLCIGIITTNPVDINKYKIQNDYHAIHVWEEEIDKIIKVNVYHSNEKKHAHSDLCYNFSSTNSKFGNITYDPIISYDPLNVNNCNIYYFVYSLLISLMTSFLCF